MAWTPAALSPVQWYDVPTEVARYSVPNATRMSQVSDALDLGAASFSEAFPYANGPLPAPWEPYEPAPTTPQWVCNGNKATPTLNTSGAGTFPTSFLSIGELDPMSLTAQFDLTWNADTDFLWYAKLDGFANGYFVHFVAATKVIAIRRFSFGAGVNTVIATSSTLATALQSGTHTWKVVVSGGTITVFDGSGNQIVTVTDWSYVGGVYVGIECSPTGASATVAVDNISLTSLHSHARSLAQWSSSASACPTIATSGIGGLPSLVWNGTSVQNLTGIDNTVVPNGIAVVKVGTPFTVLMVADGADTSARTYYSRVANTSNWTLATASILLSRNGWYTIHGPASGGGDDSEYTSSTILNDTGTPHSICHRCDSTNAGNKVFVDGAQVVGTNILAGNPTASSDTGQFVLGNLGFQASEAFNGRISEVVVLDRAITDLELAQWNDYVHTKYGISITDPLATASLSLGASAVASASPPASAAITLSAAGAAGVKAIAAGSLSLSGVLSAETALTTATAALSLSATMSAAVTAVATGLLSLSALGSAKAPVGGTGLIALLASGSASASPHATATLTLEADASAGARAAATALISLLAQATPDPVAIGAAGQLSLSGAVQAQAVATAVALLDLLATAVAAGAVQGGADLELMASGDAGSSAGGATGHLELAAVAAAAAYATGEAHLELLAAAIAFGHLGRRARIGSSIRNGSSISGSDAPAGAMSGQDLP